MLYTFKELKEKFKTRHQISKAIENNELFKIEKGIYSDEKDVNSFQIFAKKYPNVVFTMDSAFYYYDLTDVIPRKNYIAIHRDSKIKKTKAMQVYYLTDSLFELGKTKMIIHKAEINIYDKEKMLIELVRNRNGVGFDYYKEIINNYRKIVDDLDTRKIEDYLEYYKNRDNIFETIMNEVF